MPELQEIHTCHYIKIRDHLLQVSSVVVIGQGVFAFELCFNVPLYSNKAALMDCSSTTLKETNIFCDNRQLF